MGERQPVDAAFQQHGPAGIAGGSLKAAGMGAIHRHIVHGKRHVQPLAQPTAGVTPRRRTRHKAVAHVGGDQIEMKLPAKAREQMKENRGIEPAGETDPDAPRGCWQALPARRDAGRQISRRQFP
ncbi:hypothetical protein GCM10007933_39860 [Zoogloea oryzae]|uniref:Uncharacterized protein n=1 Tax=Zoogloea oryzae TaxID=310767 RepID=A0ABQ6FFU9_9RHOO|nr:hypothetical protein GCM10007933_39860 [Zoogloea oryzae]